ncbi:MAG TPA: flagellar hook-associated protein FlgL [Methylophilaceae bacterium]|nr:flagellar hook-associated protein FlgL [Methylophilaceae bacterium]HSI28138.1 flagellar hook-associated protein FlgL [Methylophilus sp.]
MRISTNTIYQAGINKIGALQSEQAKLQQQISTGKRITSPSDDPVAAARVLELSYQQGVNAKFADNRETAKIKLNTLESNLTSVTNLLVSTQSTLVGAGNGVYSNQERAFIATELQGSLDALIGLANTKDAYGNYLYSGFQSDTTPFTATATGATYAGDSNEQLLQVDAQRQMATNVTGNNVFQAGGNDIFTTLKSLVTLLNTPITDATTQAAFTSGLATAIGGLQGSVDNVLTVRANVGSKLNELDALDTAGSDRNLQYEKSLSDLQDLDYASALSDLAKQQTIMEAAQKSFVATTGLSLFDYI